MGSTLAVTLPLGYVYHHYQCNKLPSSSNKVTTNFVNPSYPGFDSKTGSCSFNLRLHSDVCQVMLMMTKMLLMMMMAMMIVRDPGISQDPGIEVKS